MNKKEFQALDADKQYEAYKAAEQSAADAVTAKEEADKATVEALEAKTIAEKALAEIDVEASIAAAKVKWEKEQEESAEPFNLDEEIAKAKVKWEKDQKETVKELEKAVVDLNEQLAAVEGAATSEEPTITINKVDYRIIGNVRVTDKKLAEELGKDVLTAREVAANASFAKQMLADKSGQIVEIVKAEKED